MEKIKITKILLEYYKNVTKRLQFLYKGDIIYVYKGNFVR